MVYSIGIDENGYGPVMGSLVVTGVCANKDIKDKWPPDIKDSKKLFSGNIKSYKEIEKTSLAIFSLLFGRFPENTSEFIGKLSSFKCSASKQICIKNIPPVFYWASKSEVEERSESLSEFFKKRGIRIQGIRSVILCPSTFNDFCGRGIKKDLINFLQFQKIIKYFEDVHPRLSIFAGKIGGRNKYIKFLSGGYRFWEKRILKEGAEASWYVFEKENKKTEIRFLKHVEIKSFLACLSGIVGKYIRQIIMASINISLENKHFVSGYRDNKTKKFLRDINESKFLDINNINIDCIIRKK